MDSDGDDAGGMNMFDEPKDFFKPEPEATYATHTMLDGTALSVRLVGHNPLWGHFLWNAGRTIALYLEENAKSFVAGKTVLELGAGAGLPSFVCAQNGASKVVVTDYPDADLIDNLNFNIKGLGIKPELISAVGYLWGNDPSALLEQTSNGGGFDLLILADLLFNHSEHSKLVKSVQQSLKRSPSARALVFFTPYRPWLLEKDLAFFDLAKENGFKVEKILEKVMDRVMFEEDPGDELLRRTVYGYEMKWIQPTEK